MNLIKAIKLAAGSSTMTNGLRAIRRFEKINGIKFNLSNKLHRDMVENCGEHEELIRRVRRIITRGLNVR